MSSRMLLTAQLFAKILNYLEFPEIINIINQFKYGHYTILPYVESVFSRLPTINPYNIARCCFLKRLSLPNISYINDNMLLMLPQLRSLTIKTGSDLTSDIFQSLPELKNLEILSPNTYEVDSIINSKSVKFLSNLEKLHVGNKYLRDDDMHHFKNLRILVINNSRLTPKVLNILPGLELCVINGILIKYKSSKENLKILKKLRGLREVKIYGI